VKRDYELGFILNPEVSEEQTRAILERVEQVVTTYDGQIVRVNQWGRRRLAYPIEHHRDGFYTFVDMILTPETVIELERTLKVSEEVLRHIVKRRDPKTVQKERDARAAAAAAPPAAVTADAESSAAATSAAAAPPVAEAVDAESSAAATSTQDELASPAPLAAATEEELPVDAGTTEERVDGAPVVEEDDGVEA
jgi:small subunit ribosomal protein S6